MKKEIGIKIPTVPNFIGYETEVYITGMPIASFTEKELRQIGKEWTEKLVEKGKKNNL